MSFKIKQEVMKQGRKDKNGSIVFGRRQSVREGNKLVETAIVTSQRAKFQSESFRAPFLKKTAKAKAAVDRFL